MTETEFNQAVDAIFLNIEAALDACDTDIDTETSAGILTLEFDNGSKIILNRQGPTQEIWVAAKSGGYHYRLQNGAWRNTRDGSELLASLSTYISQQAGQEIQLT
jgi:CyaY protein